MTLSTLKKHDASTLIKHDEISSLLKLDVSYEIMVDASGMIYHDPSSINKVDEPSSWIKHVRFLAVYVAISDLNTPSN